MTIIKLNNNALTSITSLPSGVGQDPDVKLDIARLGLRTFANGNLAKQNSNSASFDVFQDSTGITNLTNASRTSDEYVATVYQSVAEFSNDSNTVLLQHFNGDYTDSSSNNMGGQFTGNNMDSNNFVTGVKKFGTHSLSLNGSDEYVSTSDLNSHDGSVAFPTTGNFTIEHWFKNYTASSETNTNRMMSIGNTGTPSSGSTPGLSWGWSGGSTTQWNTYGDYSANTNWGQNFPAKTTDWRHFAIVRKSGTLYTFIDGVYKGSDNFYNGNTMNSGGGIIMYGNRSNGGAEFFYGYLDEVRVSDTDRYDTTQSAGTQVFTPNQVSASNATGSFEGTTITASSSTNKIGAVITYKDQSGTNALNSDLVLKLSADNGSNYSTATLTALPDFASGVKCCSVTDLSVTAGTQLKYKIEFANQSSGSKECRVTGVSLQY
tara:strand:- start:1378 stop:2673 length:1296 start_codon:yes stop_codon:yes gene_type:complete